MKKVFLIVLNWNGGEMTLNCLKSLEKVKCDNFILEVIVVDNGSTDESVGKIKNYIEEYSLKFVSGTGRQVKKEEIHVPPIRDNSCTQSIRLLENRVNLGYAEGNNVGIRYALENNADYVCLLNNDTRVSSDFLLELIEVAESDERIGVVGGKIYFEKGYEFHQDRYKKEELGKVIWYAGGEIDWSNVYAKHRGMDKVDEGQFDEVIETGFVNGCLMLIKSEVIKKVGLFDPNYFLYFEENDFCQRARKEGFKLFYTPKSFIWHLNAGSSAPGSGLHDYFLTRNRLLFGMKWAPLKSKIALIKESLKLLKNGREWQRIGVRDFYLGKFGKGSWR